MRIPTAIVYKRVGAQQWRARWFARPFVTLTEFGFEYGTPHSHYGFSSTRHRR